MPPSKRTPAQTRRERLRTERGRVQGNGRSSSGPPAWHGDDGITVIQAPGLAQSFSLHLEWSQLGSSTGFQDVRQLQQEVVNSLQDGTDEFIDADKFKDLNADQIMLQILGSVESLDPDATLVGPEGKAARDQIKRAGHLDVWPAGDAKRSRAQDKLPAKPRYYGSDFAEALPVKGKNFSFSEQSGTKVKIVIDEDKDGTDEWEVEYDYWSANQQPAWKPFSATLIETERNQKAYLTLSNLQPGLTYSFRIRGIRKGKAASAWGQVRTPVCMKQGSAPAPAP
eukprot:scaffold86118_cov54-Phaeocystis_antarctica.AAC.3